MGEVHDGLYLLQHSPSDTCAIPTQSQATPSFQAVFNSVFHSIFSTNKSHVVNNVKIQLLSGTLDLGIHLMLRFLF